MKALVLVIMYTLGFAYPLPCWPFCYKQLQGMSFQIHDQEKQRYAFAYSVALSFILIKQRLWSEKAQSRLGPEPGAVTVDIYRSCWAAKRPSTSLLRLNVKAQPEGPALQSETLIGHLSSMGIDKCKMHCGADWRCTPGQNPAALLLFWGFNPYSHSYLCFHTEAAALIPLSVDKSNVWHPPWEILKFQIKPFCRMWGHTIARKHPFIIKILLSSVWWSY